MWPPSSEDSLLARSTIAMAFQRIIERRRRSSCSSTGYSGSFCGGIVFRYGVVPAGDGAAPVSCAWPTTRSSSCWARSGPSLSRTASSASSHSRVSWGSMSCLSMSLRDLVPGATSVLHCACILRCRMRRSTPDTGVPLWAYTRVVLRVVGFLVDHAGIDERPVRHERTRDDAGARVVHAAHPTARRAAAHHPAGAAVGARAPRPARAGAALRGRHRPADGAGHAADAAGATLGLRRRLPDRERGQLLVDRQRPR